MARLTISRILLPATVSLALLVAGVLPAPKTPLALFTTNLSAIQAQRCLTAASRGEKVAAAPARSADGCLSYPATVAALQDPAVIPSQKLTLLAAPSSCWQSARPILHAGWQAEVFSDLGRHDDACGLLAQLGAGAKTVALAKQAIEAGDWSIGNLYLRCVGGIVELGVWVSPWGVAELYQRMGQHFDEIGAVDDAIAAYDAASYWHPGVWATPYVRKAQLLWDQGRTAEAVGWLVAGIPRATDATSRFYLWRELGEYWAAQGITTDAACAYRKAREVMDQVPTQNLPDTVRKLTQTRFDTLMAQSNASEQACFAAYPQLQAR